MGWLSQPTKSTAHSCTRRPPALLDLHHCLKRAKASLAALNLAGLPGHHSRQPQLPASLVLCHQGGRRGLGGINLLIAEPLVWSWLQGRSLRYIPLDSLPFAARHSSAPAILPPKSSTGLSRPLSSLLWRIGDHKTSCKVLLHERCMPECQTLLICFWFIAFHFHTTLLLHLALH